MQDTYVTPRVEIPGVDQDAAASLAELIAWKEEQRHHWRALLFRLGKLGHGRPNATRLAQRRAAAKRAKAARKVNR
jgi:hypothetical protein